MRWTWIWAVALMWIVAGRARASDRPNILIAISDDQSWLHTSISGCRSVSTPGFDSVAKRGVLFRNAFAPSPGCSPTRAALLTGRQIWQIEEAGTHASSFSTKYVTFADLLEKAGYFVGYTGKGWAPGNWKVSGRTRNPAGPAFEGHKDQPPYSGIAKEDYAANFAEFLSKKPKDQPFCFWYGAHEPHRGFERDSWKKAGRKLEEVDVPPFLQDTPTVRGDILDYCVEIDWFDQHLVKILAMLEQAGELDNTLVIVTSDNGMSFPRAKANIYEYGVHEPLAIAWPKRVPGGRTADDLVQFVDLTATILDAAGVAGPTQYPIVGHSLMNVLTSDKQGQVDPANDAAYFGRERHSSSRWHSLGYPSRGVRTDKYLYIRNFTPERWPAGAPRQIDKNGQLKPESSGYTDIDGNPTLDEMIARQNEPDIARFLHLSVDKRPGEELYDIEKDPGCLHNLATDPDARAAREKLSAQLMDYLKKTDDPRLGDDPNIFETYKRYSPLRDFPKPDWAVDHPERVPKQPWLPKDQQDQ
ncbi:MAG: sulfatase-like hydrolase/transferase [Planctomycetes bacterium]|nr:sulfatase-like hydrolase/transferase [Planctomycetota bacterium]